MQKDAKPVSKSIAFLYTSNKQAEKKIKKTIN